MAKKQRQKPVRLSAVDDARASFHHTDAERHEAAHTAAVNEVAGAAEVVPGAASDGVEVDFAGVLNAAEEALRSGSGPEALRDFISQLTPLTQKGATSRGEAEQATGLIQRIQKALVYLERTGASALATVKDEAVSRSAPDAQNRPIADDAALEKKAARRGRSDSAIEKDILAFQQDISKNETKVKSTLDRIEARITSGQADETDLNRLYKTHHLLSIIARGERTDMPAHRERYQAEYDRLQALGERLNAVWNAYETRGGVEAVQSRQKDLLADIQAGLRTVAQDERLWKLKPGTEASASEYDHRENIVFDYVYGSLDKTRLKPKVADNKLFAQALDGLAPKINLWHRVNNYLQALSPRVESRSTSRKMTAAAIEVQPEEQNMESRMDALAKALGEGAHELTQDDVWAPGTGSEDRFAMLSSQVTGAVDYTEAEIIPHLSEKGKGIFFEQARQLARFSKELADLTEQRKVLETPVQPEPETPEQPALTVAPEISLPTFAEYQTAVLRKDRDRAQIVRLMRSPRPPIHIKLNEPVVDPEVLADAKRRREAFLYNRHKQNRSAAPEARDIAQSETAEISEPIVPEVAVEQPSHLDKFDVLLAQVEGLLASAPLDAEAAFKLLDAMTPILDAETARVQALPKTTENKRQRIKDEARLRHARRDRQKRIALIRARLKKQLLDPADPDGRTLVPLEDTEKFETEARRQLQGIGDQLQAGRTLLGTRPLDATTLLELMGRIETQLSEVRRVITEQGEAGVPVAVLEADVMSLSRQLRRLQAEAHEAIGNLTSAEVGPAAHETSEAGEIIGEVAAEGEAELVKTRKPTPRKRTVPPAVPAPTTIPIVDVEYTPDPEPQSRGLFGGLRESLGKTLRYVRNGWHEIGERQLRKVAEAENGPKEMSKTELASTFVTGAATTAASALLTYSGIAIIPDAIRYFSQKSFTKAERAKIEETVRGAMEWQGQRDQFIAEAGNLDSFNAELLVRRQKLADQIDASPYDSKRKQSMLEKLDRILEDHAVAEQAIQAQAAKEVAKVLEAHITTTISEARLAKQAVNSGLAVASIMTGPTMVTGMALARGASFAAGSLAERWQKANGEAARGEQVDARLASLITSGFKEWWSGITMQGDVSKSRKAMNFLQASGQLGRALGIGAVMADGLGAEGVMSNLIERYSAVTADAEQPETPFTEVGPPYVPRVADTLVERPDVELPDVVETAPPFRGMIPEGSRVREALEGIVDAKNSLVGKGEGITSPIVRAIQANPDMYGYDSDRYPSLEMFAKLRAREMAGREDLLGVWLTEKAIDKLNIFPEYTNGEWKITAVVDGKKLTMEQLAAAGYTMPAKS